MACDIELHIEVDRPDLSAVDWLAAECDLSRSRIKQVMQCGAVWLSRQQNTRRLRRAKSILQPGDTLHLYYDANTIDSTPPEALLIADEDDYSVWFKPSGMLTQGTKWGDHHTIGRWAEQHLQPERIAKIVHRLDRHTSGVILLAHSKNAASQLSKTFRERQISKHYHAIVEGVFGEVGSVTRIDHDVDDKHALSFVTVLEIVDDRSLLNVKIETGRKHQVRRHLSESGYPIVGDKMFGSEAPEGLQLCAVELAFTCPLTQQERLYETPTQLRPAF